MNDPSVNRLLTDSEKFIHILLDHIIDGKDVSFAPDDDSSLFLPKSVISRLSQGLEDNKIDGHMVVSDHS